MFIHPFFFKPLLHPNRHLPAQEVSIALIMGVGYPLVPYV
jgi:hypothetical protein